MKGNEPVYPTMTKHHDDETKTPVFITTAGLTKREYMATQAMVGLLAKQVDGGTWSGEKGEIRLAECSCAYADALINELNKTEEK